MFDPKHIPSSNHIIEKYLEDLLDNTNIPTEEKQVLI